MELRVSRSGTSTPEKSVLLLLRCLRFANENTGVMYIQLQFNFDSIESNKASSYERIFVCYTYKRRRVSNEFFMIHKRRLRRWLVTNGINIKFSL